MSDKDIEILRRLAGEVAQIASLPVHKEKAKLWTKLNDLRSERPMVWVSEICWNEMNVDDELTLRCEHPWAKDQEDQLRKTIYQWKHLPGDMVVNEIITEKKEIDFMIPAIADFWRRKFFPNTD